MVGVLIVFRKELLKYMLYELFTLLRCLDLTHPEVEERASALSICKYEPVTSCLMDPISKHVPL